MERLFLKGPPMDLAVWRGSVLSVTSDSGRRENQMKGTSHEELSHMT